MSSCAAALLPATIRPMCPPMPPPAPPRSLSRTRCFIETACSNLQSWLLWAPAQSTPNAPSPRYPAWWAFPASLDHEKQDVFKNVHTYCMYRQARGPCILALQPKLGPQNATVLVLKVDQPFHSEYPAEKTSHRKGAMLHEAPVKLKRFELDSFSLRDQMPVFLVRLLFFFRMKARLTRQHRIGTAPPFWSLSIREYVGVHD